MFDFAEVVYREVEMMLQMKRGYSDRWAEEIERRRMR
jgi:hypothetical protein